MRTTILLAAGGCSCRRSCRPAATRQRRRRHHGRAPVRRPDGRRPRPRQPGRAEARRRCRAGPRVRRPGLQRRWRRLRGQRPGVGPGRRRSAFENWIARGGIGASMPGPDDGYVVERVEGDRVLLSYDVDGADQGGGDRRRRHPGLERRRRLGRGELGPVRPGRARRPRSPTSWASTVWQDGEGDGCRSARLHVGRRARALRLAGHRLPAPAATTPSCVTRRRAPGLPADDVLGHRARSRRTRRTRASSTTAGGCGSRRTAARRTWSPSRTRRTSSAGPRRASRSAAPDPGHDEGPGPAVWRTPVLSVTEPCGPVRRRCAPRRGSRGAGIDMAPTSIRVREADDGRGADVGVAVPTLPREGRLHVGLVLAGEGEGGGGVDGSVHGGLLGSDLA